MNCVNVTSKEKQMHLSVSQSFPSSRIKWDVISTKCRIEKIQGELTASSLQMSIYYNVSCLQIRKPMQAGDTTLDIPPWIKWALKWRERVNDEVQEWCLLHIYLTIYFHGASKKNILNKRSQRNWTDFYLSNCDFFNILICVFSILLGTRFSKGRAWSQAPKPKSAYYPAAFTKIKGSSSWKWNCLLRTKRMW